MSESKENQKTAAREEKTPPIDTPKSGPHETKNIHPDTSLEHPKSSDETRGPIGSEKVPSQPGPATLKEPTDNVKDRLAKLAEMNAKLRTSARTELSASLPVAEVTSGTPVEESSKTSATVIMEEDELNLVEDVEAARALLIERKMSRIAQVLKESGADSMSQIKAMDRIREIL